MNYDFDKTLDHKTNGSIRWAQPTGRQDILGLGTADLDFFCPPCVKAACQTVLEENTFNYRKKPEAYFDAVQSFYQKYGLDIDRAWLSAVPGALGAVRLALAAVAKPGDTIILQTPRFSPLERAISGMGCKMIENPMRLQNGQYSLDFLDFEDKIRQYKPAAFLLVNPHNPSGRVFTPQELQRLVDICEAHGVKIVSDEVHSLILHGGRRHYPILSVSDTARSLSIQIVSMSKGFNMMSLPHAIVCIADATLRQQWHAAADGFSFEYASNLHTIAAVTSVMSGQADDWLAALTQRISDNITLAVDFIGQNIPELIPIVPEGSFLLWLDCHALKVEGRLADYFLTHAGVSVYDGTEFGSGGDGFIRLNLGVSQNILTQALTRMATLIQGARVQSDF